jgi:RND family efflux transporter MFP subunit
MNDLNTSEERLRAEIAELRRQLEEQKKGHLASRRRGSGLKVFFFLVLFLAVVAGAFFAGYLPRQHREQVLAAETQMEVESLPVVTVALSQRASSLSPLVLPANTQAITEAPVLARTSGYVKRRNVDIGDRVQSGQVLAELEAPELDQQIRQAQAAVDQAASMIQQSEAALQQGRSNENLSKITAQRWANLASRGVVSKQENDTYQAQYAAQQANVQALEKAVSAARSNAAAAEANLARLNQLKSYQEVRAPFAGVITVRNVDVGALVNEGNTLLFRIAQTDKLRAYVNVPQNYADDVKVGLPATLSLTELPGRKFSGTVTRTSNALDPATRTLLTEIQVPNNSGALLPGMYAQVQFTVPLKEPPIIVPGDTLVVRSDGTQVATVDGDGKIHFTHIQVGRDFGDTLEVLSGITAGQQLVVSPSDAVREGVRVKPVLAETRPEGGKKGGKKS